MQWVEGAAIGILVGTAGAVWLMLSLVSIRRAVQKHESGIIARLAALFTLPVFVGGSTWSSQSLFANMFSVDAILAYVVACSLTITALNALPIYKLMLWAAENMDDQQ
jgi:hypothetical protein